MHPRIERRAQSFRRRRPARRTRWPPACSAGGGAEPNGETRSRFARFRARPYGGEHEARLEAEPSHGARTRALEREVANRGAVHVRPAQGQVMDKPGMLRMVIALDGKAAVAEADVPA